MPRRVVKYVRDEKVWQWVFVVGLAAFSLWAYVQFVRVNDSLCKFRSGLVIGVASSKDYIDDVNEGRRRPIPGISQADIQLSIERQQKIIDTLDLHC